MSTNEDRLSIAHTDPRPIYRAALEEVTTWQIIRRIAWHAWDEVQWGFRLAIAIAMPCLILIGALELLKWACNG